jgi:hypothetical protein
MFLGYYNYSRPKYRETEISVTNEMILVQENECEAQVTQPKSEKSTKQQESDQPDSIQRYNNQLSSTTRRNDSLKFQVILLKVFANSCQFVLGHCSSGVRYGCIILFVPCTRARNQA